MCSGRSARLTFPYDAIRKALQNSRITPSWRPKLIDVLQKIPIVPTIDLSCIIR